MGLQMKIDAKNEHYSSVSEFVRHLYRKHKTERLAKEIETERAAFKAGKGRLLRSLKDLR